MSRDYDLINSISDEPIEIYDNDSLSMQKQINGLSRYLSTCSCPLTVSIQGRWGSGKTSFFNMVRNKLENNQNNNCLFVEFNAWQYSQFSKDANLPVSLFASITNQIKKEISDDNPYINDNYIQDSKYLDTLKTVISFIGTVGNRYAEKKFGFNILSEKRKFQEEREEFNKLMNGVNAISKLQNDFKQFVEEALEKKFKKLDDKSRRNSRIIVFIDDLDRLLPEKAVDLLDIIKIFLDCPRCVFVLAVDYDVIINGVEKKYQYPEKRKRRFQTIVQIQ